MDYTFLLNSITSLAVAFICFYTYVAWSKYKKSCGIEKPIGLIGIIYTISFFLNLLWFLKLQSVSHNEFMLIMSIFAEFTSALLLIIIYIIQNKKQILYLLFLFLLSFIVIPYGIDKFFILLYVLSNLVIIPVMLDLIIFKNLCLKKAGWYGLAYAITSIIIGGIVFFNITSTQSLLFIPYTLLFLMILCFFYDVKMCGLSFVRKLKEKKKRSVTGLFIRYLLYVVSLSAFIFFSTIAVHELGHALTAKAYGCEHSKAVVFDIHDYPHTEMVCENKTEMTDIMITIAGLAITFVLGTAFLLTGGEFATRLAYLIYGFSLFLSFNDIKELGFSQNSIFIIMFFAVLIIVVALVMISIKYLNEQYYDCKGKDLESRGSEEEKNGKKKKS